MIIDQPLYLMGLKNIINDNPNFNVLDYCSNISELLFPLKIVKAEMAIIGLSCPEGEIDIRDVIEQLNDNYLGMTLVALGGNNRH